MTSTPSDSTADRIEFSTEYGTVYLTGTEIDQIESDPVLEVADVVRYRAGGELA